MHPIRHILIATFLLFPTLAAAQLHWAPSERGIEGAHVYALHETLTGAIIAETRIGLFRFEGERWTQVLAPTFRLLPPPSSLRPSYGYSSDPCTHRNDCTSIMSRGRRSLRSLRTRSANSSSDP
jgi:hypothetical protein